MDDQNHSFNECKKEELFYGSPAGSFIGENLEILSKHDTFRPLCGTRPHSVFIHFKLSTSRE